MNTPRTDEAEKPSVNGGDKVDFLSLSKNLEYENAILLCVLKRLYDETADYIRINNLGDVHHNQSMRSARDVIERVSLMYEDDLPDSITDAEYEAWFKKSILVDGVRMGPRS